MVRRLRLRPLLAALAALAAALTASGCVSIPAGGPVLSYSVTQGPNAQGQPYVQMVARGPGAGWKPTDIVTGFLTASATFGNHSAVAREFLTPAARDSWNPSWSAIEYKNGPAIKGAATPVPGAADTVRVTVTGQELAYLVGNGTYSVASASGPHTASPAFSPTQSFTLKRTGGQWRISQAPDELLLTSASFNADYELRNLYFLDPSKRYLVPDPVYVPLQVDGPGELLNGLVSDLITPPLDWLHDATTTALPSGTRIAGVNLEGVTAVVNLSGAITKADTPTLQRISAQLLATLPTGSQSTATGQQVQSVELEINGRPWVPPNGQGSPVQTASEAALSPATGASSVFYFVDSAGYLNRQSGLTGKPTHLMHIGTGFSQIAVSPDGRYLAALRGSTLYAGLIGAPLNERGSGYQSVSWDFSDDLWASTGGQLELFRGSNNSRQPLGQPAAVSVPSPPPGLSPPYTQLRVAPDGVRVALVAGSGSNGVLVVGAISGQQPGTPSITFSQVQVSPASGTAFTALSWYGSGDVVTLAAPGPVATKYSVSGGSPQSLPVTSGMTSITASWTRPLIAGLPHGKLAGDVSLSGQWVPAGTGSAPVYPG